MRYTVQKCMNRLIWYTTIITHLEGNAPWLGSSGSVNVTPINAKLRQILSWKVIFLSIHDSQGPLWKETDYQIVFINSLNYFKSFEIAVGTTAQRPIHYISVNGR